jgi:hypothetical protein
MPIEDLRKEMEAMLLITGFVQCENKDLIKSFYDPSQHYPLPKQKKVNAERPDKLYFPKEQPHMKYT